MTRFAPPDLHQCPACAGYFKRYALMSLHFNTDVPVWSDGKCGQWWALESGHVGRCPSCSSIVWLDDAKVVMEAPFEPRPIRTLARAWHRITGDRNGRLREEREWLALPPAIKRAESIDGLQHADEFIEALTALPFGARNREVHLRCRLWWAANDHLRDCKGSDAAPPAISADVTHANMLRLLELIEHDPGDQVMRGELLRQLGRFDDAVAVLRAVRSDGYSEAKAVKIERLALAGIVELRDLQASRNEPASEAHTTELPKASERVW